jgi:hypothetical protein
MFLVSDSQTIAQELSDKLSKVFIELESIEADKAPSRAAKILCGLGFSPSDQKKKTKYLIILFSNFYNKE